VIAAALCCWVLFRGLLFRYGGAAADNAVLVVQLGKGVCCWGWIWELASCQRCVIVLSGDCSCAVLLGSVQGLVV
jgi:hypothetical protein